MRNVTFRFVFMLYYGIKYPHQFPIFVFKLTPRGDTFFKMKMDQSRRSIYFDSVYYRHSLEILS